MLNTEFCAACRQAPSVDTFHYLVTLLLTSSAPPWALPSKRRLGHPCLPAESNKGNYQPSEEQAEILTGAGSPAELPGPVQGVLRLNKSENDASILRGARRWPDGFSRSWRARLDAEKPCNILQLQAILWLRRRLPATCLCLWKNSQKSRPQPMRSRLAKVENPRKALVKLLLANGYCSSNFFEHFGCTSYSLSHCTYLRGAAAEMII